MTTKDDRYQIVFLIDLSTAVPKNEADSSSDQIAPCIRTSTLKLLTYFSNKVPDVLRLKSLRWGFKFCNSVSMRFQKYDFLDFTIDNFEEFESKVDDALESERLKTHGLVKERKAVDDAPHDVAGTGGWAAGDDETDAVDNLKHTLREVLHDFQWDRPDISSPIRHVSRRHARGRKNDNDEPRQHNMVFFFSRCPRGRRSLCTFAGVGENATRHDVLSAFMPNTLYRQFYESSKIKLYWVDVGADPLAVSGQVTSLLK